MIIMLQAVLRHLGHFGHEVLMVDDAELQCQQQLQNLYNSTRVAKVKSSKALLSNIRVYLFVMVNLMDEFCDATSATSMMVYSVQSLKNISCCTAFSAAYCSWN